MPIIGPLLQIAWHFTPEIMAQFILRFWGLVGKAAAVKMRFLGGSTLQDSGTFYTMFSMGVSNLGTDVAENAWPQIADFHSPNYQGVDPQPLLWGENLKHLYNEGETDFETRDIPPGDETNKFLIIHHSSWDSQNNALIADVPVARRPPPYVHTLVGVVAGEEVQFSITVVGDNFRCKKMRLWARMRDAGPRTWQTLECGRWYLVLRGLASDALYFSMVNDYYALAVFARRRSVIPTPSPGSIPGTASPQPQRDAR